MELILSTGSIRGVTPARLFAIAQTVGFEGLEYVVAPDHTAANVNEIKILADDTGLRVLNVHAPYMPVPGWGDQIDSLRLTVELAVHLGARSVTFHPPQRVMQDVDFARWISSIEDFQRDVGGGEVVVTMENMPKVRSWRGFRVPFTTSPFRYQDRDELWELLERHNLFMTFDTTHYGTTGESLGGTFAQFRERVKTIHLSNFRSRDFEEHTPLDDGDLDLAGFLRRVESSRYDGLITLEVRPQAFEQDPDGPKQALQRNVKWFRDVLGSLRRDPHPEVRPAG
jgi:sugar phosphate isomerase/epimerase